MRDTADVPLAPLTTLRLGGPARRLVEVHTEDELVATLRRLDAAGESALVLAGGSNVVIADEGFPGTVVRIATRGVRRDGAPGGRVELEVQAGEPWDPFVAACVEDGLSGVECLSGIPGSTGATPIQNVGAYGQEVAVSVVSVRALDRATGEVRELPPEECRFGYRTSAFRRNERWVVLAVTFALARDGSSAPVSYAELAGALGVDLGERVPARAAREAVLELRRGKGMVVRPEDPDSVSAGSFFTNPILTLDEFEALAARAADAGRPPAWPEPDGRLKTSAAWLIERAGFRRGHGNGRVGISSRHTLALVNRGGGTTGELLALAREIAAGVADRFGVELAPEPVLVGHEW